MNGDSSVFYLHRRYEADYSSQSGTNGMKSLVIDKHSFLLFIEGFRTEIMNASNVLLAVSVSWARTMHFTFQVFSTM
ncbi:hypothetical protein Y032_0181g868 [Ancylostoma ceylanicum]|uniref:Uncharacterized protein n=1 Tax=Ancylostoma ceylanicum TaxID=53326 RepID=A0A016ST80_9BILA|nr:hypothetical protein Y032_0181g868 [Ancylostoma ceylanicum]